ncbi:hypothetical protein CLV91_3304 [Maribacter vaceletii]|uniref:Anti-sigma factor n=1 Tax=Maribacter vaceletii TaxID=1206816 RepID=A0A495DS43_9FLAO|nr:hypothetical protein [Maribacter vaceletii]RKR06449.1 hypothetical protein CLV91_3304 [Maribacter vaceletii]
MEKDTINKLFNDLHGSFDIEEPIAGHENRFLEKLLKKNTIATISKKDTSWWKPLSIAASITLLCFLAIGSINNRLTKEEQVAEISPEISKSELYFVSLIDKQIKELEKENKPETKKIIEDTLFQLKKLEKNYNQLEQDLLNGGNSKLILSAMITNFQTRIDLLNEVLAQIERIKNIKNTYDENSTI